MKRGKFISAGIACIVAILALLMEETAMAKTVNRSGSSKSDFAMECINTCKWTASDIVHRTFPQAALPHLAGISALSVLKYP